VKKSEVAKTVYSEVWNPYFSLKNSLSSLIVFGPWITIWSHLELFSKHGLLGPPNLISIFVSLN